MAYETVVYIWTQQTLVPSQLLSPSGDFVATETGAVAEATLHPSVAPSEGVLMSIRSLQIPTWLISSSLIPTQLIPLLTSAKANIDTFQ